MSFLMLSFECDKAEYRHTEWIDHFIRNEYPVVGAAFAM